MQPASLRVLGLAPFHISLLHYLWISWPSLWGIQQPYPLELPWSCASSVKEVKPWGKLQVLLLLSVHAQNLFSLTEFRGWSHWPVSVWQGTWRHLREECLLVYENLKRIYILLLCENHVSLNYVESVPCACQGYYTLYVSEYSFDDTPKKDIYLFKI